MPQDGGGGYRAEYPARQANRSLAQIAKELVDSAERSESRAVVDEDAAYQRWRGRSLRMAAAFVFEVCGLPTEAAEAIRGSHG
ncbi:hypothetical protein WMF30_10845 [Sorangium sp. So ce134]